MKVTPTPPALLVPPPPLPAPRRGQHLPLGVPTRDWAEPGGAGPGAAASLVAPPGVPRRGRARSSCCAVSPRGPRNGDGPVPTAVRGTERLAGVPHITRGAVTQPREPPPPPPPRPTEMVSGRGGAPGRRRCRTVRVGGRAGASPPVAPIHILEVPHPARPDGSSRGRTQRRGASAGARTGRASPHRRPHTDPDVGLRAKSGDSVGPFCSHHPAARAPSGGTSPPLYPALSPGQGVTRSPSPGRAMAVVPNWDPSPPPSSGPGSAVGIPCPHAAGGADLELWPHNTAGPFPSGWGHLAVPTSPSTWVAAPCPGAEIPVLEARGCFPVSAAPQQAEVGKGGGWLHPGLSHGLVAAAGTGGCHSASARPPLHGGQSETYPTPASASPSEVVMVEPWVSVGGDRGPHPMR